MNRGLLMGFGSAVAPSSRAPSRWTAGEYYAVDDDAWSPISGHVYRRLTAGSGGSDPSSVGTSWKLVGPGGVRQIQRGIQALGAGTASSGSVAITPVLSMSNCTLKITSTMENGAAGTLSGQAQLVFISTSFIQFTRLATTNPVDISWELVEYWA